MTQTGHFYGDEYTDLQDDSDPQLDYRNTGHKAPSLLVYDYRRTTRDGQCPECRELVRAGTKAWFTVEGPIIHTGCYAGKLGGRS